MRNGDSLFRASQNRQATGTRSCCLEGLNVLSLYLPSHYLVQNSLGVITDSGGIMEETTLMGVPCMTGDSTERPTVDIGTNEPIGTDPDLIPEAVTRLITGQWKKAAFLKSGTGRRKKGLYVLAEKFT